MGEARTASPPGLSAAREEEFEEGATVHGHRPCDRQRATGVAGGGGGGGPPRGGGPGGGARAPPARGAGGGAPAPPGGPRGGAPPPADAIATRCGDRRCRPTGDDAP